MSKGEMWVKTRTASRIKFQITTYDSYLSCSISHITSLGGSLVASLIYLIVTAVEKSI